MNKKFYSFFLICITLVCSCVFVYLEYKVITMQNYYEPKPSSAIVILGHSLEDGEHPDIWLKERLSKGFSLYQEHFADYIVVTGGKAEHDQISAALAMKNWLLNQGVSEDKILMETNSKNTIENFKFSKEMADKHSINSIIVVTNDFHMYRSMVIGSDFFADISGCAANTPFGIRKILAYIKEPLSLVKYYGLKYLL